MTNFSDFVASCVRHRANCSPNGPFLGGLYRGCTVIDVFVRFTNEQEGDVRIRQNERTLMSVQSRHVRMIWSGTEPVHDTVVHGADLTTCRILWFVRGELLGNDFWCFFSARQCFSTSDWWPSRLRWSIEHFLAPKIRHHACTTQVIGLKMLKSDPKYWMTDEHLLETLLGTTTLQQVRRTSPQSEPSTKQQETVLQEHATFIAIVMLTTRLETVYGPLRTRRREMRLVLSSQDSTSRISFQAETGSSFRIRIDLALHYGCVIVQDWKVRVEFVGMSSTSLCKKLGQMWPSLYQASY